MKKMWIMGMLIVLSVTIATAQDFEKFFYLSWDMNKPLTNTNSWIEGSTLKGAKLGFRRLINDNFSYGIDASWSVYDQYEPKTTFQTESGALTTDYFKYTYSYSLQLSGQYYLPTNNKRKMMPFVGLGMGAVVNRYALYYNVYSEQDNSVGFMVSPEVGILFPFGGKVGAIISGHYNYSTIKNEYFELNGFSHVGVNVGIVFMTY